MLVHSGYNLLSYERQELANTLILPWVRFGLTVSTSQEAYSLGCLLAGCLDFHATARPSLFGLLWSF